MHQDNPLVPDGGWGWIIVTCSFLIHMFVVGTLYALSVLYVSWLDAFNNSKGYTSWILSLAVAVMFGIGPLPGFISRRFSNRVTVIVGGILMFLGFFSSVFATSVLHLICSVGIVAGIGAGCCYLPSVSMVAMYFSTKRSIAMGLSSAGLGVGAFLMPLYLNWMVETYGWRGCMLILSGLSLNMCVLGVLMRPLKYDKGSTENSETDCLYLEKETPYISCENFTSDEGAYFCAECSATNCSQINESSKFIRCKHHGLPVIEISLSEYQEDNKERTNQGHPRSRLTLSPLVRESGENAQCENNNVHTTTGAPKNKAFRSSAMHLSELKHEHLHFNKIGGSLQCIKRGSSSIQSSTNIASSIESLGTTKPPPLSPSSSLSNIQIMMSGNIYSALHSCRVVNSLMSLQSDRHSHKTGIPCSTDASKDQNCTRNIDVSESDKLGDENSIARKSRSSRIRQKLVSSLSVYLKLFKDSTFMVFCISNFLTNLSFFMPVLYMVDRAIDEGMSKNDAAILVSLYGAGNIFGKLFFGWLADREIIDRLIIYIGCLVMAGLATSVSPLCGDEEAFQGIYSFSFGCFIGSYCTLYPIVTVDLVGLEVVDESVGVILCFMGMATAFGSPLAGWIFDWTGSYTMAYALHGVFILISAVMMIPSFVIMHYRKKDQCDA